MVERKEMSKVSEFKTRMHELVGHADIRVSVRVLELPLYAMRCTSISGCLLQLILMQSTIHAGIVGSNFPRICKESLTCSGV